MSKSRICINICGLDYVILSDENQEYCVQLSQEIYNKIKEIINSNEGINKFMAAVLTAMNFCDKYKKSEALVSNLKDINKKCLKGEMDAKNVAEKLKKDNELLKNKLKEIKKKY
ncbi:MAG: cell division protein ZapA [Candidatus Improbicoccus devescovinae]|nr:MAG: cell division protein ZapA [Candidatus Improbicoccus devescovinae]